MAFESTVKGKEFADAIQRCAALVPTHATIPIIGNLLLRAGESGFDIAGTSMDQSLTATIPCDCKGATTAPAATLASIAARIDESKELSLKATDKTLTITQGRASWRLRTLPREDYPESVTSKIEGFSWEIEAASFASHLKALESAINTGHILSSLHGIFFDLERDVPHFAATDANRLGSIAIDGLAPPKAPGFILPEPAIKPLTDMADGVTSIRLTLAPNAITAETDRARFWTRLLSGKYAAYQKVIPADRPNKFRVDRSALAATLNRVSAIEGDEIRVGKGKMLVHAVHLEMGHKQIVAKTMNGRGAEVTDVVDCERVAGDDARITVNGAYLSWAMDSLAPKQEIELGVAEPGQPITVAAADDADRRSVRVIVTMLG